MQTRRTDRKRFLVTDYDNCAFSAFSTNPQNLSQPILNMALDNKYDGFYACTHRAYSDIDLSMKLAIKWGSWKGFDAERIKQNFPTHKITVNFAKATHLINQAVSTLDDLLFPACGDAYINILHPYEKFGTLAPAGTYVPKTKVVMNATSKNRQLTQIAQHAAENNPDTDILLEYVDDMERLCTNAKTAESSQDWPANVRLNIYHYNSNSINPVKIWQALNDDDLSSSSSETDIFYDTQEYFDENPPQSYLISTLFGFFRPTPRKEEPPANNFAPSP